MIKTILFDIQGVVVHVHSDRAYHEYLSTQNGKPPEYFQTAAFAEPWYKLEEGKISLDSFLLEVSRLSGISVKDTRWVEFYREGLRPNKEVIGIIARLRKDYVVAAFTNMDSGRYAVTLEVFNPNIFQHIYTTFDIGLRKPKPEAFQKVLRSLGATPDEAVYIDDRSENLRGAEEIGMHTILFKNAEVLIQKLCELGVVLRISD